MKQQIAFFIILSMLPLGGMAQVGGDFGHVVGRMEPMAPLSPTMAPVVGPKMGVKPVAGILEDEPEVTFEPVPQRLEAVSEESFVILPAEAPLPQGTLNSDILAPKPIRRYSAGAGDDLEAPVTPEKPKLKAEIFTTPDGDTRLRLMGESAGKRAQQIQLVMPEIEKPKPKVVEKPKVKPLPQPKTYNLAYEFDLLAPTDKAEKAMISSLKTLGDLDKIEWIYVTLQVHPVPFGGTEQLQADRVAYLKKALAEAGISLKKVKLSVVQLVSNEAPQVGSIQLRWGK